MVVKQRKHKKDGFLMQISLNCHILDIVFNLHLMLKHYDPLIDSAFNI